MRIASKTFILSVPLFSLSPYIHAMDTTLDIRTGISQDFMQWSIASDITGSATPNILSELTWENVESAQTFVGVESYFDTQKRFALLGHISLGVIYAGSNQDSDYSGNDRTSEFSRSNNSGDAGDTLSFSIGVGFNLMANSDFELMPMLGYAEHQQNLKITNGYQTIPSSGSIAGLDSSYDAAWTGPWLGLRFGLKGDVRAYIDYRVHKIDYVGLADWNLRTDFKHPVSFRHDADGIGQTLQLGLLFNLNQMVDIGLNYTYQDWKTDAGVDTTFFSSGAIGITRLNEVVWTADVYSMNVIVHY